MDFFHKNDHRVVSSSPVVPFDDPTILFTNAGMNQFKDVFTGKRKVDYKRATSSQKCIRAGGKHNDLDNVGFTARHLTFFEMLGNFSFGDYYKEEAIAFAWEWVTKYLKLDKNRLYATVFETDDDSFELWGKIAPELKNGRILRFGKKDNFWSMGDIGPCGPCSEIHYDQGEKFGTGPEAVVNGESDRYVEIWNLVFMQDDQLPDGTVVPLPKPSVDTGAGLERNAAIMQNVDSVYGIDLFQNIIKAISDVVHASYKNNVSSHHVIADHLRSLTFALTDGAGISNEGRGYVLRRILRRAARHGRLLGAEEPFIYKLVPVLVDEMGEAYPELKEKQQHVQNVIKTEEEAFNRTLETGLTLFERLASKAKKEKKTVIDGEDVFQLYDTFGFPYDLTEIIATEQGLTLDRSGFDKAMGQRQEQSRAGANFDVVVQENLDKMIAELESKSLEKLSKTEFVRDYSLTMTSTVLQAAIGLYPEIALVLDKSPFYVEAGGQISDLGRIFCDAWEMEITSLVNHQGYYVHIGRMTRGKAEDVKGNAKVTAQVADQRRWDIMRNHTATHLAHAALRKVLGEHVKQSGSYVGPDRMRFDFSHHKPMTEEEIDEVEKIVNEQILRAEDVTTEIKDLDEAKKSGAMALFGEKYDDKVRVVSVPGFSMELCGGTHVQNVSQIGPFFIILETGIASGIRRIEAITGREAIKYMLENKHLRRKTAQLVNRPESEVLEGVEKLRQEYTDLQKELKKTKEQMFSGGGATPGEETAIGSLTLITHDFGNIDRDTMGAWIDNRKAQNKPVVAVAVGEINNKQTIMIAASSQAEKELKIDINKVFKELSQEQPVRGGGKSSFAQGKIEGVMNNLILKNIEDILRWILNARKA